MSIPRIKTIYYPLIYKTPFGISHLTRTETPAVFIQLEHQNILAYGEACMPPYTGETPQQALDFFKNLELPSDLDDFHTPENLLLIKDKYKIGYATLAALDLALWDWRAKKKACSVQELCGLKATKKGKSTFTFSTNDVDLLESKLEEQKKFSCYKLKLGTENDFDFVEKYMNLSTKPFCVDANQGWKSLEEGIIKSKKLAETGAFLIEQPFSKTNYELHTLLRKETSLPIVADEGIQTLEDLKNYGHFFDGINIKLMKCGGLTFALEMLDYCQKNNLKTMVGCMSESSCGVSAGAILATQTDWCDLDGPFLISNNPFLGFDINLEGEIELQTNIGLGIYPDQKAIIF